MIYTVSSYDSHIIRIDHLLYDDYTLERIYDVLYVYKVHYTLPERIRYNRIMHLC